MFVLQIALQTHFHIGKGILDWQSENISDNPYYIYCYFWGRQAEMWVEVSALVNLRRFGSAF
jgi:hypothetical protein